jgi:hypothetical protein
LKEERALYDLAQIEIPEVLNSTFHLNPLAMSTEGLAAAIPESF